MSASSSQSHYLRVRPDWLARRNEAILEPELPIVDPHHHLWDRPDWRYLLPELLEDLNSGHKITATVFVQCRAFHRAGGAEEMKPVGETEFVNGVAAMSASDAMAPTRICAGIVGHANLTSGARVENGAGRACPRRRRSVSRHPPHHRMGPRSGHAQSGLSRAGRAARGCGVPRRICEAGAMDLTFDAWLYHPQIPELTSLARAFPARANRARPCRRAAGNRVVCGPARGDFPEWRATIRELATCANVHVKLGGLGMRINGFGFEAQAEPPSSEQLASGVEALYRHLHRGVRPAALHVREQFPGR